MKKFVVILSACLCACSLGGYSRNSTFYMMNSNDLTAVSQRKISVGVSKIKVPDLLNKPQMVVYDKDSQQVEILEFERWGERLPYVLQNTITNDMQKYLPNSFVKSVEYSSENLDYTVKIKINKLEAYQNDKVLLSAWWHIENVDGRIISRKQGIYETAVQGEEISDLVKAQNSAVHALSKDISEALGKI